MKSIEEMAWEYALKVEPPPIEELENFARYCFGVAEAMQVEAEKRKNKGDMRSLTKDENGNCLHFHHEFGHKKCMDCGASLEKWQPDWSRAPSWANYWLKTSGSGFAWVEYKPAISNLSDCWNLECNKKAIAPPFNYQGDWKDSLRKRP